MNRIFGRGKKKEPPPTLDDTSKRLEGRADGVHGKIQKLDQELVRIREQMKKMRDGPAKSRLKQRGMQILKQKRMYEGHRDQLYNQQFNIDQTNFAVDTVKDSIDTYKTLQTAAKDMKREYKKVNLSKIEDLQDDLFDMMEDANEIQEVLGRSYDTPEDLDEGDLEAELDALGDELEMDMLAADSELGGGAELEGGGGGGGGAIPEYMREDIAAADAAEPSAPQEPARQPTSAI